MKIEEGEYYRARSGEVFGPMQRSGEQIYFWWVADASWAWTATGKFSVDDEEDDMDLISKVYVSDTPPDAVKDIEADLRAKLITTGPGPIIEEPRHTKTLRDEFAMAAVASCAVGPQTYRDAEFPETAAAAYAFADAMMEARKK